MKAFKVPWLAANLMYHDMQGDGTPIILIHGLGCASSCDYPAVASDPCLVGKRIILVDLLGSGFSERPIEFAYTIEEHTKVLASFISEVCSEPISLFGHSMGGAIAIATAAQLGGKVRRIALGEPNLDAGGGVFSKQIASMTEHDYVMRGHQETANNARANGNVIWASSLSRSAAYAIHRGVSSLVAGSTPSWRKTLYEMMIPKTVIFGARSLPNADFESLQYYGCSVEVVAEAGHSMAWDNPSGLATALRNSFS
ncbi:alpha/beta hydrolase [Methylobacterium sp. EM32]|uniref:alpha/beta fold hydrolase n=1 Tax=Methylobacterium sp. EM32 TaxID=3163481 RepID=UPI0033B96C6E